MTIRRKRKPKVSKIRRTLRAGAVKEADLELTGTLELQAADGDANAEPKLFLSANTGKPMQVGGFDHDVIVDFNGASFDKNVTPIIADHKTTNRIGHTTEQVIIRHGMTAKLGGKAIRGPFIGAVGVRSSDMEIAKGIMVDAKKGFPFQVSIGARIKKGYVLADGETAEVNGKSVKGPLIVATRSVIRELSITVLGADNDTSAIVTAKEKEIEMNFEAWVESLGLTLADLSKDTVAKLKAQHAKLNLSDDDDDDDVPAPKGKKSKGKGKVKTKVKASDDDDDTDDDLDASDDTVDVLNARLADNTLRIESINDLAAEFSDSLGKGEFEVEGKKTTLGKLKAEAIRKKWSPTVFELQLRRADRVNAATGPAIHMVNKDVDAKALEVSILRSCGIPVEATNSKTGREYGLDQHYDEKTLTASHLKQYNLNNRISRLFMVQIQASGRHVIHFDGSELIADCHAAWGQLRASGISTISVTNILENVMHKAAWSGFEATETVWREICAVKPLNDFRPYNLYRLDFNGHFRKVPVDGELKHISMVDTKKTIQADTYGAMIAIDRKTQIDDDLGLIVQKARGFGSLGGQRVEELIFTTLLANPSSFFSSGNGNLISGASSSLGPTAFNVARRKFRDQVINGKPIAITPDRLLVGTGLEGMARDLFIEDRFTVVGDPGTAAAPYFEKNQFKGLYRPIISGYLNNSNITDQDGLGISGQSNTQWYLFPNPNAPQGSALCVGFLNGRETPYIDEAETQFSIPGGIQMRAYYDFGAAMHITQMALRSAGQ